MKKVNLHISAVSIVIFYILINGLLSVIAQETGRIRMTNRHYRSGDWVTYSTTRFIHHLAIGPDEIYFATTGGITRFNHFSNQWEEPYTMSDGLASNHISLVAFDVATGYLWCITENSISYLESASKLWYNFFYDELGFYDRESVHSIGFSEDRRVFLVTERDRWFSSLNTSGNFFPQAPDNNSTKVVWFGAMAEAEQLPTFLNVPYGYFYDPQNNLITDTHLRRFRITCWMRDNWNNLWLGTWGLGAGRADLNTTNMDLLTFGLWNPTVHTIAGDIDGLWLGGIQQQEAPAGITYWSGLDAEPIYYEPLLISGFHDDRITQIAVDGQTVWYATQNGLTRYNAEKNSWHTFNQSDHLVDNRIEDIIIDGHTVWVATRAGLSAVEKKASAKKDTLRFQIVDYKTLANVWIYDLDRTENLIWAATEFGLYFYDKAKKNGEFYRGTLGPGTQRTFAVSCYGEEVWYATEQGVSALLMDESTTEDWPLYALRNYQIHSRTWRLFADSSAVWLATQEGVIRLDRQSSRWIHYTIEDGLPSNAIYSILLDGDYIWFGSRAGLTRFYWNAPYRID
ncbi:hypothetical protein JXO59_08980 [candidate division KSB1 bacterium]|nr:hypothetical protein [candidate division KSB1 bacterium]